jgi:hypothetical protein
MRALLQRGGVLAAGGCLSPQGLALLLWVPGALRVSLPGRWVDGVLAAAGGYLPLFSPREAACLLGALARLQHIPPGAWMDVWWGGSEALLRHAAGQQLVQMLWAAVRLGLAPPASWLRAWLDAAAGAMAGGRLSARGYGLMWDAAAQLAGAGRGAAAPLLQHGGWWAAYWQGSVAPRVLAGMGPLTAERTLAGLAAAAVAAQELAGGSGGGAAAGGGGRQTRPLPWLAPPGPWLAAFLRASRALLPQANLYNISNMLVAAAQLELGLPPSWLAAAMARLQRLLTAAGVLQPAGRSHDADAGAQDGGGSSTRAQRTRSLALSARLQRRWLCMCLTRVLYGLRAQQLLTPLPQRRLWHAASMAAAAAAADADSAACGRSGAGQPPDAARCDVLSVWPWLREAVVTCWPDSASAQQALAALGVR